MADLVVIPVYNEERSVAKVLCEVRHYAPTCDILVVDDGSTDTTRRILSAEHGIKLLTHVANEGYGRSLIDGFAFAHAGGYYRRLVTIDCDEQHEPALVPRFLEHLDATGADVVSASRYLESFPEDRDPPDDRRRINRVITWRINEITGWQLTDAFCGFKAYRVAALDRLALDEPGYAMPMQFWIRAWRAGLKIVEIAIPRIYNESDRSFGADLDFPDRRLLYYESVMDAELTPRAASA